jgi:hypothetical protein
MTRGIHQLHVLTAFIDIHPTKLSPEWFGRIHHFRPPNPSHKLDTGE